METIPTKRSDPCESCMAHRVLELFARVGGRTLGLQSYDCGNCFYANVGEIEYGKDKETGEVSAGL